MTQRTDREPATATDRLADHAAIDRLTDDLLPALVAKLAASGLGEIEVREGDWHVRVRMSGGDPAQVPARGTGADVHGATGGSGGSPLRGGAASSARAGAPSPDGGRVSARPEAAPGDPGAWDVQSTVAGARSSGAGQDGPEPGAVDRRSRPRAVATSPAVGIYRPRQGVALGSRVRSGDRVGVVDVLGVPHDVLSPADGVVGGSYVEPGSGVEYGQELVRIELAAEPTSPGAPSVTADPAAPTRAGAAGDPSAEAAPPSAAPTRPGGAGDPIEPTSRPAAAGDLPGPGR